MLTEEYIAKRNDVVKDFHIDWGASTNQVNGQDIPIVDVGSLITATDVDGALTEIITDVNGFPDQLKSLETVEIQQLETIGDRTITYNQWGYVGEQDQSVKSGSAPTFTADNFSDGGSNAIITTTQETNFESAYTHVSSDGKDHSDVVLNNTHRSSNGTDHGHINQDVQSSASPTFDQLTISSTGTNNTSAVRYDQLMSVVGGLDWQDSVLDITDKASATETTGFRYIASETSGGWTIHYVYEWNGTSWDETIPNEGFTCWVEDVDTNYTFNGSAWVEFGSTVSHNNTTGLQGGDTDEYYHTDAAQHTVITQAATTSLDGYLSSTDWTTFNGKVDAAGAVSAVEAAGLTFASSQTLKFNTGATIGIINTSFVDNDTSVMTSQAIKEKIENYGYSTTVGTVTAVTATAPVESTEGTTPVISMDVATGSANGYLSSTNWSTFNGKQDALTFGIADTNAVKIDGTATNTQYALFTANGIKSADATAMRTYLSISNVDDVSINSWTGSANVVTVGALASGSITTGFTAIGDSFISSATTWNGKVNAAGAVSAVEAAGLAFVSTKTLKFNTGATISVINTTFVDNDTSVMTSQAIKEKIENYGYSTTVGTVTAVTATAPVESTEGTTPIISMDAATGSVNGYMTSTYATKLNGIAESANNYVHPTTDGDLHVSATSTTNEGRILTSNATAGSFGWKTYNSISGIPTTENWGTSSIPDLSGWSGTATTFEVVASKGYRSNPIHVVQSNASKDRVFIEQIGNNLVYQVWIYPNQTNKRIWINARSSVANCWLVKFEADGYIDFSSDTNIIAYTTTWTHIAVVWTKNSTADLYVNHTLVYSGTCSDYDVDRIRFNGVDTATEYWIDEHSSYGEQPKPFLMDWDSINSKSPIDAPTFTTSITIPSTADDTTYTGIVTNDSGVLKYRTKSEILGDIGAASTTHATAHSSGQGDPISHNNLANLNAGDNYEHITQSQKTALHTVYSHPDYTEDDEDLTNTQTIDQITVVNGHISAITTQSIGFPSSINNVSEDTSPSLGGNLDSNGKYIQLDYEPSSDHIATGLVIEFRASGTVTIGHAVYKRTTSEEVAHCKETTASSFPCIGIAIGTASFGNPVKILISGTFRDDSFSFTRGDVLYPTGQDGTLSATAPSASGDQVQRVAVAISDDCILVNPSLDVLEIT